MGRPRLAIVVLLGVCAFLGALAVARASEDTNTAAEPAPKPLAAGAASDSVATIGRAAAVPGMKRKKQRAAGQTASTSRPAASPAPAPAPSPAPLPSPAPAPAPAPKPAPKPSDPGTPFLDVH